MTRQLISRPRRSRDLRAEAAAFMALSALTVEDPRSALQFALDFALEATRAGSSGIGLLDTDYRGTEIFRWTAISGGLAGHVGEVVPRDLSPCGLCLDAGHTIVVSRFSSGSAYLSADARPLLEGLIVPLYDAGTVPLGVLWVVHHEIDGRFDAEDTRVMQHLAEQVVLALKLCEPSALDAPATSAEAYDGLGEDTYKTNSFVRKLDRLGSLSSADRSVLARISAGSRSVEAGTDLFREGASPDGLYVVMEGYACRYKLRSDGARQITDYFVPGDFCEADVALGTMNDSVATLSASKVVKISRDVLNETTQHHPAILAALRKSSLVNEATLREWLMNIGRRSAEERIAHLFCELLTRMQAIGLAQNNSFRLPLTQFDLGDTIGLSYVHVNRTLQSLRQKGLIVLRGKTLTILNVQGLKALAEFKSGYLHASELAVL